VKNLFNTSPKNDSYDAMVDMAVELRVLSDLPKTGRTAEQENRRKELLSLLEEVVTSDKLREVIDYLVNATVGNLAFEDFDIEEMHEFLNSEDAQIPKIGGNKHTLETLGEVMVRNTEAARVLTSKLERISYLLHQLENHLNNCRRRAKSLLVFDSVTMSDAVFENYIPFSVSTIMVELDALEKVYKTRLESLAHQKAVVGRLFDAQANAGLRMPGAVGEIESLGNGNPNHGKGNPFNK
jgi:hypothetical protein